MGNPLETDDNWGTPILGNHHMNMGLSPAEYMHVRKTNKFQWVLVVKCCQQVYPPTDLT